MSCSGTAKSDVTGRYAVCKSSPHSSSYSSTSISTEIRLFAVQMYPLEVQGWVKNYAGIFSWRRILVEGALPSEGPVTDTDQGAMASTQGR